jgi:hypothetical protein
VSGQPRSTSLRRGKVWQRLTAALDTLVDLSVFDGPRGESAIDAVQHYTLRKVQVITCVGVRVLAGKGGLFSCDQMRSLVHAHQRFGVDHVTEVGDD